MIKAAAANGWIDERAVAMEALLAFKAPAPTACHPRRAGCGEVAAETR